MTTATPTGLCKDCLATGLPILPVRYAIVPSNVVATTATGPGMTDVNLGPDYKYILRTLRYGYLYVYYETHPRKSKYWECYGITGDGLLVKQPLITYAIQPGDTVKCTTNGHSNTRLEFFVIEEAQNCGVTWIAYSSHRWTDAVRKQVEADPSILMQKIEPSKLIANDKPSGPHISAATPEHLKWVADYTPNFDSSQLPYDTNSRGISEENGKHDSGKLAQRSTIHPWRPRGKTGDKTVAAMKKQGVRPNAPPHGGIILALGDAEGIAEELNGYMADIEGRNAQYILERGLQVSAIDAFKKTFAALEAGIIAEWRLEPDPYEQTTLKAAVLQCVAHDPRDTNQVAKIYQTLSNHDDEFKAGSIPEAHYKEQRSAYIRKYAANPAEMERRYAEIDKHRQQRWARQLMDRDVALKKQFIGLKDRLDLKAISTFNDNWQAFRDECDKLMDARAKALIKWLESEPLLNTLESYDRNDAYDGGKFQNCIGQIIFGLPNTHSGSEKLSAWVKEGVANKTNLVWRTFALNQDDGVKGIDEALAYAKENHLVEHTQATLAASVSNIKNWQRLVDTFKKGFTMDVTNTRAATEKTKAFGATLFSYNLRGTDKFFATVCNKIFDLWIVKAPGDFVGEAIIKRIILNRGGADDNEVLRVMTAMTKEKKPTNRDLLNFINSSRAMLEDLPEEQRYSARAKELANAWENLKGGRNKLDALKDSRLTMAVMAVEAVNLYKLSVTSKGDAVSRAKIGLSAASLTAGAIDIWSLGHKALWGTGDVSYQKLKLYGGALSGMASFIGGMMDIAKGIEKLDHPRWGVPALYILKGGLGMGSGAMTWSAAFTYSARYMETFAGKKAVIKVTEEELVKAAAVRGEAIVVRRVIFMSAGLWLTLIALALEVAIVYMDDSDMEKWFDKCAFGKKRADGGFTDTTEQIKALRSAVRFEL